MKEEIIFTIAPTAKVTIKAEGFTDGRCAAETKPYEDALKGELTRKPEPAFYKPVVKKTNAAKKR